MKRARITDYPLHPSSTQYGQARIIGTSPAGVEWVSYHPDEESITRMERNLARQWDRWNQRFVRISKLTPAQVYHIEEAMPFEDSEWRREHGVEQGKTFIEMSRLGWMDIAQGLQNKLDDPDAFLINCDDEWNDAKREAQWNFGCQIYLRLVEHALGFGEAQALRQQFRIHKVDWNAKVPARDRRIDARVR